MLLAFVVFKRFWALFALELQFVESLLYVFIKNFAHLKLLLAVWACPLLLQPLEDAWVANKLRTVRAFLGIINDVEANHTCEIIVKGLCDTLLRI